MATDHIRYDLLVQEALRSVVLPVASLALLLPLLCPGLDLSAQANRPLLLRHL